MSRKLTKDGREILSGKDYQARCLEVYVRDDRRCVLCGGFLPGFSTGFIDHIRKRGSGGGWRDDRASKLRTLCPLCHDAEDNRGGKRSEKAKAQQGD